MSRFVLRNGMTVIISEQHAAPVVAAVAYFKIGAVDEPEDAIGISRLLARMVMRGTAAKPADKLAAELRAIGAMAGAEGTPDGTAYYLVAGPGKIKDALAIQAEMLKNPALAADDLRREAAQLAEEDNYLDAPAIAKRRAGRLAMAGSLLGRAFSTVEVARQISRDRLMEFYRNAYRPENLIVAVAGDVSTFNALVEIQQLYGDFAPAIQQTAAAQPAQTQAAGPTSKPQAASKTTDRPSSTPTPHSGPQTATTGAQPVAAEQTPRLRYLAERGDISQSFVTVGFRVPELSSKDRAALDLLTAIAGQGRGSRLHRSLVEGQAVAYHVDADYFAVADDGLLVIQASMGTGQIDKAEAAVFKELDRLRRELVSEAELARARAFLEKRFVDEIGIYLGRASRLARTEAAGGDFRIALDYIKALGEVRADDVQRAAARYLGLANTSVYEYEPFNAPARRFDAERFAATVMAWVPEFGEAVEPKQVRTPEPQSDLPVVAQRTGRSPEQQAMFESVQPLAVKDFSTLNGPRAFVREDHSQPSVTVALLFQGGRLVEDDATGGITELMLRSMLHGTARRPSAETALELEQLGAGVEVVSEPDFFGLLISTLSRNADRALKIVSDLIEEPAFRDEDIERARAVQIGLIRKARDLGALRARYLFFQSLYPTHPYAIPIHGREEAVARINGDQLREWHARTVKRQLPTAIIVGDTEGSALVSGQLAEGFRRRDLDQAIKVRVPQPAPASEKVEAVRDRRTTLCLGFAGPKADGATAAAFELIEAAMTGAGGRLGEELVNKQNLARSVTLEAKGLFAAGAIYACLVTAPENERRARAALISELDRFARAGLSAGEIAAARALASTNRIVSLQSHKLRALEYARAVYYGRDAGSVDSFAEQLSKVTPEEIKRIASSYFKPSATSAGIVRGN
jgi:zinc protease